MQQLQLNTKLQGGKYIIKKVLGQGGFGITYLTEQIMLGKLFAIKEFFIRDLCARDDSATVYSVTQSDMVDRYRLKFIKEAQIIARFNHPGIVRVTDIFEENGTVYYVMDYVEGENLDEIIKREGALPEERALGYITKVAEALDYIHQHNVNHLDIKPSNIMIRKNDDQPILIDFGVSKQYDEHMDQTTTTPPGVSNGYSPLEQYRPGGVSTFSPQADIYALGASLYKILTGNTPPSASDLLNNGLSPMPGISTNMRTAVWKAMQPRIGDRPNTIIAFVKMLKKTVDKKNNEEKNGEKSSNISNSRDTHEDTIAINESSVDKVRQRNMGKKDLIKGNKEKPKPVKNSIFNNISANKVNIIETKKGKKELEEKKILLKQNGDSLRKSTLQNSKKTVKSQILKTKKETKTNEEEIERKRLNKIDEDLYLMGNNYYYGQNGVKKNYIMAFESFRKAAEQGNPKAIYQLGFCYEKGDGVDKDEKLSIAWYKKAIPELISMSELGDSDSQCYLGECYQKGLTLPKDFSKAAEWFHRAAKQGNARGQFNLGICFFEGKGIKKSYAKAFECFAVAAKKGFALAQYKLGHCYEQGHGTKKDLTIAINWYRQAAEQGHAGAQYRMGEYYYAQDIKRNSAIAMEWYLKAAEQGYADAQYSLGKCYLFSKGNKKKAAEWFLMAAEQGHADAQYYLGEYYYNNKDIKRHFGLSVNWFRKAAEQGHASAQYHLGYCYHYYKGVKKDCSKALYWFQKAAEQGQIDAQYYLGFYFEHGIIIGKDYQKAREWYRKAANKGHVCAKERLNLLKKKKN